MQNISTEKNGFNLHAQQVHCDYLQPCRSVPDLPDDVRAGLLSKPRSLPPKYFYDARGSALFERITTTPEYYPTRTEDELLAQHAIAIIEQTRPVEILELGSGSSRKTRRLFDACNNLDFRCDYAPLDVCEAALIEAATELKQSYPWLRVNPVVGDYHAGLGQLPDCSGRRLFLFLGSTIGNFEPETAAAFMREVHDAMQPGDYLLLGADRVKQSEILNAAYNDSAGITADFNLNILNVLNRELDADFALHQFRHQAHYDSNKQRVEMRLVASTRQSIKLAKLDTTIAMEAGESILTELSHKFTAEGLEQLITQAGLAPKQHIEADDQLFSLLLAEKPAV